MRLGWPMKLMFARFLRTSLGILGRSIKDLLRCAGDQPRRKTGTRTSRIHGVASYLLLGSGRAFGMRPALTREIDRLDIADEGEFRAHTLARRSDGAVVGWGYNSSGQCNTPTPPALTDCVTRVVRPS